MRKKPKISVVILVYNMMKFLGQCFESLRRQTYANLEILCVDDGSADGSADFLDAQSKIDSRIRVFRQANQGAASARNHALDNATGDYIAFLDPDDWYPQDTTLEELITGALENNVSVCGGGWESHRMDGTVQTEYDSHWFGYNVPKRSCIMKYSDCQYDYGYQRFIYSRRLIEDNNLRFPPYLKFQDPPFFVRAMYAAGTYYCLNKPTYCYRCSFNYKQIDWASNDYIKLRHMILGLGDLLSFSRDKKLHQLHALVYDRINKDMLKRFYDGAVDCIDIYKELVRLNGLVDWEMLKEFHEEHPDGLLTGLRTRLKVFDELSQNYTAKLPNEMLPPVASEKVPKVSVVVPVYGVEMYLCECLDSLLEQTYRDFEVICVDDGSTDASSLVLSHYAKKDGRFRWVRTKNGGLSAARNTGMDLARGEYIYFLDSDDKITPDAISGLVTICEQHQLDQVIFSCNVFMTEENEDLRRQADRFNRYYKQDLSLCGKVMRGDQLFASMVAKGCFYVTQQLRFYAIAPLREHKCRFPEGLLHEDNYFAPLSLRWARKAMLVSNRYFQRRVRGGSIMTSAINHAAHLHGLFGVVIALCTNNDLWTDSELFKNALRCHISLLCRSLGWYCRDVPVEKWDEAIRDVVQSNLMGDERITTEFILPLLKDRVIEYARVNRAEKQIASLKESVKEVRKLQSLVAIKDKRIDIFEREVQRGISELDELFNSEAYRVGMFVTWPARKAWGGVKCLRENGVKYTVKHAVGKVLRLFGSTCKW